MLAISYKITPAFKEKTLDLQAALNVWVNPVYEVQLHSAVEAHPELISHRAIKTDRILVVGDSLGDYREESIPRMYTHAKIQALLELT